MPVFSVAPAGYVPRMSMCFSDANGITEEVKASNPLPVNLQPRLASAPLDGAANASVLAGPFAPISDRAIMLTLSGTWTGSVRLLRSTDQGVTKLGLTALGSPYGLFQTNLCEPVWEEAESGATLYLDITVTSGNVIYRMGQ